MNTSHNTEHRRLLRPVQLLLAAFLPIVSGYAQSDTVDAEYWVRVAPALDQLDVSACYHSGTPRELAADNTLQRNLRGRFYIDGRSANPHFRRQRLQLSSNTRCFRYQVVLDLNRSTRSWSGSYRVGRDVVSKPQHWLIQPHYPQPDRSIQLRFLLPAGIAVSAPWPEQRESPPAQPPTHIEAGLQTYPSVFSLGATPATWDMQVAFGHFKVDSVPVGGTQIRTAVLDSSPPVSLSATHRWLQEAAAATLNVHGRFPQDEPQALIVPVGAQREAVPFARVLRGGGVALQFYIDPIRPFEEFSRDWTATHEFSHLLLPYVSRQDAWLSEGLASYLQNILRVRDGRISEHQGWSKLYAGFQRGQRASARRGSSGSSPSRRWSTMRIYWGGAAIWLMADVELRRRSAGQHSIDTALAGIHRCCMNPGRLWRARGLMQALDRATGHTVFMELYQRHAQAAPFPPVAAVLRDIGVDTRGSQVRLNDQARDAAIRHQIMAR